MAGSLMNPGAFNLGAILAGGGQIREQAKSAEELRMIQLAQQKAETDRQVDEAVMAARKRSGQQAIDADTSIPQTIRNLIAGEGGTQYSAATEGQLHQQAFDNRAAAVKAFAEGHPDLGNASLAGIASGPLQLTKVEGNNIIRNPYSTQGSVVADEIGNALIGDHAAAARQHDAAANLSNVKAAGGGFAPHVAAAGKGGAYTELKPEEIAAAFPQIAVADALAGSDASTAYKKGQPTGKVNKALAGVFKEWRNAEVAQDPRFNNAHYALDHFPGGPEATAWLRQNQSLEHGMRADGADPSVIAQVAAAAESGKDFDIPAGPVPAAAAPIIAALAGQHPAAPALVPGADKVGDVLRQAREAVSKGANPNAVRERLIKAGYKHIAGRI